MTIAMVDESKPSAIPTQPARVAIGAIIIYQLLLIGLILLRPDLDPSWHTISEWAIGPYGWLMSLAFFVSAVSYAALLIALRSQLGGRLGRAGLFILFLCVIGAVGVSIFTTDPMPLRPPLSARGTLHVVFGTTQLVLLPFAALLINISLVTNPAWASARRALLSTAFVPLCGFMAFVVYSVLFVAPHGPGAYGPGVNIGWPPRIAFFSYMVWVVTIGWTATRVEAAPRHEDFIADRAIEGR
ncbi:MAG TPA: DUF998 domain-containing protein [Thermoanaerobaculia bacterium]|nr:DUF998 domain-containing protein [Thermoanaerobaculia bacterium]